MGYPKPDGWEGGSGGKFLQTGNAGHLSANPFLKDDYPDRDHDAEIGSFPLQNDGMSYEDERTPSDCYDYD